jgi:hypothetical protein
MTVFELLSEVDCRIAHGAKSNGHLEFVRNQLNVICAMQRLLSNNETECATDKQRVERAKAEIEAVITKLNNECDMKPDRVLVFWSLQADGWKCEISMK